MTTTAHEADQERARSALSFLNYNDEDVWIDAAMGLKSEFGDAGFDIWEAWGSQYERYNAKEARARWKSVKAGGRKTIASVFYDAKAAGWKDDKKYAKPSREVIEQRKADAAKRHAEAEAQEASDHAAAAQHAKFMWDTAKPLEGDDHPYLKRKGVASHGLRVGAWEKIDHENGEVRVISEQALLVPIRDIKKNIHSLQAIFSGKAMGDRDKDFVTDGAISGMFYSFGKPVVAEVLGAQHQVIMIGEGYATLASAHAATGHACIVAFHAGNIPKVARVLRERFPDAVLVFLADNDQWTDDNPGIRRARQAVDEVGGFMAVPPFDYSEGKLDREGKLRGPSDFNDLHALRGLDAVREAIEAALNPPDEREATVVLAPDREVAAAAAYALGGTTDGATLSRGAALGVAVIQTYGDNLGRRLAELGKRYPNGRVYVLARPGQEQDAQTIAGTHGAQVETLTEFGSGQFSCWADALLDAANLNADVCDEARQAANKTLRRAAAQLALTEADAVNLSTQALPSAAPGVANRWQIDDVHHMDPIAEMSWPHLDLKRMKPRNTIPNLRHLLSHYEFTVRYDVIRKDMLIIHPGQRGTRDNARSKAIDTVVSLCSLNELAKTDAPAFLMSIADDQPYNPVIEFVAAKPWDGVPRLPDLLATVETKPGFDRDLFAMLMRRWLISAVAAAAKPSGFWSKGVLVFQGDQSLGKTAWFRSLLPQQMRDLVKVDASIDPANKDTVISAVAHWLVELGELDGTLRKADIARLKGFISQDVDQFRRPYGRGEEKFQRRTVFFASVNPEHFLADDTGNVRWWTVPVIALNHGHAIDMQQLWAEIYSLFQAGERWWLDRDEERMLNTSNVQYEQRDPIDELISSRYDFDDPLRRQLTATQVLLELGYQSPGKKLLNDAGSAMRKHFVELPRTGKGRFFEVPNLLRSCSRTSAF